MFLLSTNKNGILLVCQTVNCSRIILWTQQILHSI